MQHFGLYTFNNRSCHVSTEGVWLPPTVIYFVFVVKIISFASRWKKFIYSNILLHWKYSQQILRRKKVLWHKLLSSLLAYVTQYPCRWCFQVSGVSLSLMFTCRNQGHVSLSLFQSKGQISRSRSLSQSVSSAAILSSNQDSGSAESDRRRALTHCFPQISGCLFNATGYGRKNLVVKNFLLLQFGEKFC